MEEVIVTAPRLTWRAFQSGWFPQHQKPHGSGRRGHAARNAYQRYLRRQQRAEHEYWEGVLDGTEPYPGQDGHLLEEVMVYGTAIANPAIANRLWYIAAHLSTELSRVRLGSAAILAYLAWQLKDLPKKDADEALALILTTIANEAGMFITGTGLVFSAAMQRIQAFGEGALVYDELGTPSYEPNVYDQPIQLDNKVVQMIPATDGYDFTVDFEIPQDMPGADVWAPPAPDFYPEPGYSEWAPSTPDWGVDIPDTVPPPGGPAPENKPLPVPWWDQPDTKPPLAPHPFDPANKPPGEFVPRVDPSTYPWNQPRPDTGEWDDFLRRQAEWEYLPDIERIYQNADLGVPEYTTERPDWDRKTTRKRQRDDQQARRSAIASTVITDTSVGWETQTDLSPDYPRRIPRVKITVTMPSPKRIKLSFRIKPAGKDYGNERSKDKKSAHNRAYIRLLSFVNATYGVADEVIDFYNVFAKNLYFEYNGRTITIDKLPILEQIAVLQRIYDGSLDYEFDAQQAQRDLIAEQAQDKAIGTYTKWEKGAFREILDEFNLTQLPSTTIRQLGQLSGA